MKKAYVKPEMFYENFELSHNIASCSVDGGDTRSEANSLDGNTCEYEFPFFSDPVFSDSNNSCGTKLNDVQDYCYQNGTAGFNFFHS